MYSKFVHSFATKNCVKTYLGQTTGNLNLIKQCTIIALACHFSFARAARSTGTPWLHLNTGSVSAGVCVLVDSLLSTAKLADAVADDGTLGVAAAGVVGCACLRR